MKGKRKGVRFSVQGLPCAPPTPPNLQVKVGQYGSFNFNGTLCTVRMYVVLPLSLSQLLILAFFFVRKNWKVESVTSTTVTFCQAFGRRSECVPLTHSDAIENFTLSVSGVRYHCAIPKQSLGEPLGLGLGLGLTFSVHRHIPSL